METARVRLARAGNRDEDGVALIGDEGVGGDVADQRLVDRRIGKSKSSPAAAWRR